MNMNATLDVCTGLTAAFDTLSAKQTDAVRKMKAHKESIADLNRKLGAVESEKLELQRRQDEYKQAYQSVRSAQKKAKEDSESARAEVLALRQAKTELADTETARATFRATNRSCVRNVLEGMVAAEDRVCMKLHFHAWWLQREARLRAQRLAFQVAGASSALKAHQQQKREQSRHVLEHMLADQACGVLAVALGAWTAVVIEEKELRVAEGRLKAAEEKMSLCQRQKLEQSKAVMRHMMEAQEADTMRNVFLMWLNIFQEEKEEKAAEKRLHEKEQRLQQFSDRKRQEAHAVLARLTGNVALAIADETFFAWALLVANTKAEAQREKEMKAESDRISAAMRQRKAEAKHVLERSLAAGTTAMCQLVFRQWIAVVEEEKKERELVAEAEAQLRELRWKKRGQAMAVIDRLILDREKNLVESVFLVWGQGAIDEKLRREVESSLRQQQQTTVDELKRQLEELLLDLEDTQEEVAESKKKTRELKQEFTRLRELEELMDQNFDNILAPSAK